MIPDSVSEQSDSGSSYHRNTIVDDIKNKKSRKALGRYTWPNHVVEGY